jgi:hypothetical protein
VGRLEEVVISFFGEFLRAGADVAELALSPRGRAVLVQAMAGDYVGAARIAVEQSREPEPKSYVDTEGHEVKCGR